MSCVIVWCSVLGVLQYVAVCCSVLKCVAMSCSNKKVFGCLRCNSQLHFYYITVHTYHCLLHLTERDPNFIT